MSKEAVAIVHIDPARVREALEGEEPDVRVGANGASFRIVALTDATAVHLGIELSAEPSEQRDRLRALLGDLLDAHDDDRGVPVYPSSYTLAATTWEAALEELGEAADWVPLKVADSVADMLARFNLGGRAADLAKGLEGADPAEIMKSAMEVAREMAGRGVFKDLAKRLSTLGPQEDEDPWKALERAGATARLGDVDLEALTEQARRMLEDNPELEAELKRAIEGAADDASGEAADDAGEGEDE